MEQEFAGRVEVINRRQFNTKGKYIIYWILPFSSMSVSVAYIRLHESLYLESISQWDIQVLRIP